MMTPIKLLILPALIIALSCTSSDNNTDELKTEKNAAVSAAKKTESCLMKYEKESCELISLEKLANIVNVDQLKITSRLDEFKILKTFSCYYEWDTGRKTVTKTAVGNFESEVKNVVNVGNIKILEDYGGNSTYKDSFDENFDDRTPEEKAKIEQDMLERVDTEDPMVTELAKQAAKLISDISYTPLQNLGDGAYFKKTKMGKVELYVLHQNLFFYVGADTSNEIEESLADAIEVAREILLLCK